MRYLRTNTATIVTVGPFYDKTDGVTIETGLTITNERISFVVDLNDGSAADACARQRDWRHLCHFQ